MRRRDFLKWMGGVIGASLGGGVAYARESSVIDTSTNDVFIPNLSRSIRIVAVSDLHAPSYFRYNDYDDLIDKIRLQSPDIFVLAGDVVDQPREENLVNRFGCIKANIAKLAVLGNWEYNVSLDLKRLRNEYEKAGVTLLVNEKIILGGLPVVGLDDFLYGSPNYFLLNNEASSNLLLVISHCPECFDFMPLSQRKPSIVLSGHTHGGQIAPLGVVLMKPAGCGSYEKGWYSRGQHRMYVMRGVGTSGIPLRIGSRPEILVLNLHNKDSMT